MSSKPYILVVEDEEKWAHIFDRALRAKFHVEKATSIEEAIIFIQGKLDHIELAIVDIRMSVDHRDRSGLEILFMLNEKNIPCIASTAYFDHYAQTVRDVFIKGGFPGHAVLVLDLARASDKRGVALLGQSYMPAQNLHVLRPRAGAVWFELDRHRDVKTPFWRPFPWSSLRRL